MSDLAARLAPYSMGASDDKTGAVEIIAEHFDQLHRTISATAQAVEGLDALDDARAADIASLTARVEALEARRDG